MTTNTNTPTTSTPEHQHQHLESVERREHKAPMNAILRDGQWARRAFSTTY